MIELDSNPFFQQIPEQQAQPRVIVDVESVGTLDSEVFLEKETAELFQDNVVSLQDLTFQILVIISILLYDEYLLLLLNYNEGVWSE